MKSGGPYDQTASLHKIPLLGPDCFVVALDRRMRCHGQHGLNGQTHILLASEPDLKPLHEAVACVGIPLLDARIARNPWTLVPYWKLPKRPTSNRLFLWKETGAKSSGIPANASVVESASAWCEEALNRPMEATGRMRNLHVDLIYLAQGGALLVLTWSHLLFDGKGAEMLAGYLARAEPLKITVPAKPPARPMRERLARARPVVEHLFQIARHNYRSLSGPRSLPGRLRFQVTELTSEQSALAGQRASTYAHPLLSMAFYLASAARAHRRIFLARGEDPPHYVVSIPVQVRKKGRSENVFHNTVSILFFHFDREHLESLHDATKAAQEQFETMTRDRLDRSFEEVLDLMRRLPSTAYMKFVGVQFSGEITSFFHSFTGDFSVPMETFFGARVQQVFHVPAVSAPPGTGVFVGCWRGRMYVTVSWRDTACTKAEASALLNSMVEDLTGIDLRTGRKNEIL